MDRVILFIFLAAGLLHWQVALTRAEVIPGPASRLIEEIIIDSFSSGPSNTKSKDGSQSVTQIEDTQPKAEAATLSENRKHKLIEDRENADLKAQQDMAFWAAYMFWLTASGLLASFLGLLMIWRTLHHTRRAADYALAMVKEAGETTTAAKDSVAVTRQIGEAQTRAYLSCSKARYELKDNGLQVWFTVRNHGQSPAVEIAFEGGGRFSTSVGTAPEQTAQSPITWFDLTECDVLPAGVESEEFIFIKVDEMSKFSRGPVSAPFNPFHLKFFLEWKDVFGWYHEMEFWLFPDLYSILIIGKGPTVLPSGQLKVGVSKLQPPSRSKRSEAEKRTLTDD